MNTKYVLIGLGVVTLLVVIAWLVFVPVPVKESPRPATLPTDTGAFQSATSSSGSRISVRGFGGGTVSILNPLTDPSTAKDPYQPDFYYLGYHFQPVGAPPDPTASIDAPYQIVYIPSTHFFNVVLLEEPIGKARKEAETYLMNHLGIGVADLCRLDYMVAVPHWVNEQFTGRNLLFGVCPNATQLPE